MWSIYRSFVIFYESQHDRIKELEILNLEGCGINSWENLKNVFSGQSKLEWLILNDNQLESITCEKGIDKTLTFYFIIAFSSTSINVS